MLEEPSKSGFWNYFDGFWKKDFIDFEIDFSFLILIKVLNSILAELSKFNRLQQLNWILKKHVLIEGINLVLGDLGEALHPNNWSAPPNI